MRLCSKLGLASILVVALALAGHARGQEIDKASWLSELRKEALKKGIRGDTIDKAFQHFKPIKRVIELDRSQPEFTLTFPQYLNRVVPERRIVKGRNKLEKHKKILIEIGNKYGVQPRFIVALWGIETDFGRIDGGFSVINSLATLAIDGRRSKFFRGQLIRALRILDQGHITLERMRGSWAGAMGQFQFMPSSFENFAVDYDGDGKRDIWRNKKDAFASAANYLARSGWKGDQTWGRQIILPSGFNEKLIGLKVGKNMEEWRGLGIRRYDGGDLPSRNLRGSLVKANGGGNAVFLVYDNFRTILKWNRSTFFAVAVGTLANKIGKLK